MVERVQEGAALLSFILAEKPTAQSSDGGQGSNTENVSDPFF